VTRDGDLAERMDRTDLRGMRQGRTNVYETPFSAQAMRVAQTKLLAGAPMICRSLMVRVL
jgi:hypothetical protein